MACCARTSCMSHMGSACDQPAVPVAAPGPCLEQEHCLLLPCLARLIPTWRGRQGCVQVQIIPRSSVFRASAKRNLGSPLVLPWVCSCWGCMKCLVFIASCPNGSLSRCSGGLCSLPFLPSELGCCDTFEKQQGSYLEKSPFGGSFQSDWLSGVLFACLGAPIPKSLRKMAEATNGTLLAKHCLSTPVLYCLVPRNLCWLLTWIGWCNYASQPTIAMGKWVPLVGISKELAPWRSTHQPVWEWGVGGVCFV